MQSGRRGGEEGGRREGRADDTDERQRRRDTTADDEAKSEGGEEERKREEGRGKRERRSETGSREELPSRAPIAEGEERVESERASPAKHSVPGHTLPNAISDETLKAGLKFLHRIGLDNRTREDIVQTNGSERRPQNIIRRTCVCHVAEKAIVTPGGTRTRGTRKGGSRRERKEDGERTRAQTKNISMKHS